MGSTGVAETAAKHAHTKWFVASRDVDIQSGSLILTVFTNVYTHAIMELVTFVLTTQTIGQLVT